MRAQWNRNDDLMHAAYFLLEDRMTADVQSQLAAAQWRALARGYNAKFPWAPVTADTAKPRPNRLRDFFDNRLEGPGIWKWLHYFDIYDRHFHRFRDQEVHLLEIGIYSGGSLDMWRDYFGPKAHIYGVDIEPACRVYENDKVKVFIGDQADRQFWSEFRQAVPVLDIVIDDGGHLPEQQIVSAEELLPHLRPGGIYCCEDVHGELNPFLSYVQGLHHRLNQARWVEKPPEANEDRIVSACNPFQTAVNSIHHYPFVTVVERNAGPVTELCCPKHGTQWQPFLK
jgi:hypothetical protein